MTEDDLRTPEQLIFYIGQLRGELRVLGECRTLNKGWTDEREIILTRAAEWIANRSRPLHPHPGAHP